CRANNHSRSIERSNEGAVMGSTESKTFREDPHATSITRHHRHPRLWPCRPRTRRRFREATASDRTAERAGASRLSREWIVLGNGRKRRQGRAEKPLFR